MILCITTTGLHVIRPCTYRGKHGILCPDRDVNRAIHEHLHGEAPEETCTGCLPRRADRGYLCHRCYDRVLEAHSKWGPFAKLVIETEGRAVAAEGDGIKSAAPDGFTNLPLTFLTLDECERLLRSRAGRTIDLWVHTEDGARDAIMFAHAAERAYRSLEVEKRELRLERVRCPHCQHLSLTQNPTREHRGATLIECQNCGEPLDKIRDHTPRWVGSEVCADADHLDCRSLHCRCSCHELGRPSQVAGVAALWDADLHAARPDLAPRDLWTVADATTITRRDTENERRTA
jgi:hypothetical protein